MKVESNAARSINERGNQVLTVTSTVRSENLQGVLPAGKEYEGKFVELEVKGGEVHVSFEVEAHEPTTPVDVPKLPSELPTHEQEQIFLASQLKRGDLTEQEKQTISEKLTSSASSEGEDAEQVRS